MQQYTTAVGAPGLNRHLIPQYWGTRHRLSVIVRLQCHSGWGRLSSIRSSSRLVWRAASGQPDSHSSTAAAPAAPQDSELGQELGQKSQKPTAYELVTSEDDDTPTTVLSAADAQEQQQYWQRTAELLLHLLVHAQHALLHKLLTKSRLSYIGVDMAVSAAASALLPGLAGLPVIYVFNNQQGAAARLCRWIDDAQVALSHQQIGDSAVILGAAPEVGRLAAELTPSQQQQWQQQLGLTGSMAGAAVVISSGDAQLHDWISLPCGFQLDMPRDDARGVAWNDMKPQTDRLLATLVEWDAAAGQQQVLLKAPALRHLAQRLSNVDSRSVYLPLAPEPLQMGQQLWASSDAKLRKGALYQLLQLGDSPACFGHRIISSGSTSSNSSSSEGRVAAGEPSDEQQQQQKPGLMASTAVDNDGDTSSSADTGSSNGPPSSDPISSSEDHDSSTSSASPAQVHQQQQYRVRTAELLLQLLMRIQYVLHPVGNAKPRKLNLRLKGMGINMAVSAAANAVLSGLPGRHVMYVLYKEKGGAVCLRSWLTHAPIAAMVCQRVGDSAVIIGSPLDVKMLASQLTPPRQQQWHQQLGLADSRAGAALVTVDDDAQLQDWSAVPFTGGVPLQQAEVFDMIKNLLQSLVQWDVAAGEQQLLKAPAHKHLQACLKSNTAQLKKDLEPMRLEVLRLGQQLWCSSDSKMQVLGFAGPSDSAVNEPDHEQVPDLADQQPSGEQLLPSMEQLSPGELLSLLHASPAGQIGSLNELADVLPAGCNILLNMLQARQAPGSSAEVALTAAQSWLLPQLLAEDRPPLLVAAAAAEQADDAVAAVLMAAAVEVAPEAAAEATAGGEAEEGEDFAATEDDHFGQDNVPSAGINGSSVSVASGGWSVSAGALAVPAELPWEVEDDLNQQSETAAEGAAAAGTAAEPLPWETDREPGVDEEADEADEADDLDWQQQQQQQQDDLQRPGQDSMEATPDLPADTVDGGISSSAHDAADDDADSNQAAAQPHLLLLCPTSAAAEAAAAQHGEMLAATGVTTTVLPGDLVAQLAAASALKQQSSLQKKLDSTQLEQQLQQLTHQINQASQQHADRLSQDGLLQKLQQQWQQLLEAHAAVITADQLDGMLQEVVDLDPTTWADHPERMQKLVDAVSVHLQRQQQALAEAGSEYCSWTTIVNEAANLSRTPTGAVRPALVPRQTLTVSEAKYAEFCKGCRKQQQQEQLKQNPVLEEAKSHCSDSELKKLQVSWQLVVAAYLVVDREEPLLALQQQVIDTMSEWAPTAGNISTMFWVLRMYLELALQRTVAPQVPVTYPQKPKKQLADLLSQISAVIWGTDLLFAAAADVAAVMRCQRSVIDSSVLDLRWVRWCLVLPDQQQAAPAALPATTEAESAHFSASDDDNNFWADVHEACCLHHLPVVGCSYSGILSYWDPPDMTTAARLVVVTQDLSPQLYEHLNDLSSRLNQERAMIRVAITPSPAAAAAGISSAGAKCLLLPPVWPNAWELQRLSHRLVDAVKRAEGSNSAQHPALHDIWSCMELYRTLQLHGTMYQPRLQKEPPRQERWVHQLGQQRAQQRQELVLVLQQLHKSAKKREREAYKRAGPSKVQVLAKAAAAGYPPLYLTEYEYRGYDLNWRQSVVITHDSAEQPSYRSDLDPNTPRLLKFSFTDTAEELLAEALPTLQQQQQQLQQAAEAKGILLTPGARTSTESSAIVANQGRRRRPRRPGMGLTAYRDLKQHLKELELSNEGDLAFEALQAQRLQLPAAAAREDCLALLQQHQVLVVTGETGCGKSTQVPQFILEDAIAAGNIAHTNIVASQPRRLITTSLSSRVAAERGEEVGDVVGYSIHAARKTSNITRLTFCTTGILIRRLMIDPQLANVSHVIIDEVHERGLEVDFLLTAMRQLAAARPDLKFILMSATVNAQGLVDYFQGAVKGSVGSYHISGYTYDVDEFYLEDLIEARLRTTLAAEAVAKAAKGSPFVNTTTSGSSNSSSSSSSDGLDVIRSNAQAAAAAAAQLEDLPLDARVVVNRRRGANSLNYHQEKELIGYQVEAAELSSYSPATVTELRYWAQAVTSRFSRDQHAATVTAAIQFIVEHEPDPGAVLVFLPSLASIMDVYQGLLDNHPLLVDRLKVFALHSIIPMSEQQEVFQPVEPGLRKVILATNIAESSITFDDVVVIIDSCRVNVAGFDPVNNMPRLGPKWASKASLLQRRGRAGRVRRGMALHLIPKKMADEHLELYDPPEIQQVPLADTCLLVKSLGFSDIGAFLADTPSPPDSRAVLAAVSELQKLSALDGDQQLTPLGRLLALLPGDVKVTRLVIFGALLGVLDPVLTLAAAESSTQDLLRMPNEAMVQRLAEADGSSPPVGASWIEQAREILDERRQKIAPGVSSDHEITLAIYKEYQSIMNTPNRYGSGRAPDYIIQRKLWESLLNERALSSVYKERLQYTQLLYRAGFLSFTGGAKAPLPWYSTAGPSTHDFDQLFDQEVDQLLGLDQQQQQQQPTAMDWMLGEYADAAAGLEDLFALEDTVSSTSSSKTRSPLNTAWLDGGNSSRGYGAGSTASGTAATAAAANDVLPSADLSSYKLQQLIKQYSWNADQPELLQAVLAAGLYPNFAFVEPPDSWQQAAEKEVAKKSLASKLESGRAGQCLRYTDPLNGAVRPHRRAAMSQLLPRHRWVVFSSKRFNTELGNTYLLGVTAVPDLAALLFDADMQHNLTQQTAQVSSNDTVAEAPTGSSSSNHEDEEEYGDSQLDLGTPLDAEAVEATTDSKDKRAVVKAVLFQGYAKYSIPFSDAAALVQLRHHMQLLLQIKVAGLSAEVFAASQGFSSLLLQLLQETGGSGDPVLAWLQQTQQRLLAKQQAKVEGAEQHTEEDSSLEGPAQRATEEGAEVTPSEAQQDVVTRR